MKGLHQFLFLKKLATQEKEPWAVYLDNECIDEQDALLDLKLVARSEVFEYEPPIED